MLSSIIKKKKESKTDVVCYGIWFAYPQAQLQNPKWLHAVLCVGSVISVMSNSVCSPMDCRLPGSTVHGILQERTLEWAVISSSRGSSDSGTEHTSPVSPAVGWILYLLSHQGKPNAVLGEIKAVNLQTCSHHLYRLKNELIIPSFIKAAAYDVAWMWVSKYCWYTWFKMVAEVMEPEKGSAACYCSKPENLVFIPITKEIHWVYTNLIRER